MPKATTRSRKAPPQPPAKSKKQPGKLPQPRKIPVVVPATQSERILPNPDADHTRLVADTLDLPQPRRSSRIAAGRKSQALDVEAQQDQSRELNKPKTTRGRKRKLDTSDLTADPPAKLSKSTTPKSPRSRALFQQPLPPEYRDASTQIPEPSAPLSSRVHPWLEKLAPQEPPEYQQNLQQIYTMPDPIVEQGPTPPSEITRTRSTGASGRSKTRRTRTKQLSDHNSLLEATDGNDDITRNLQVAMSQKNVLSGDELEGLLEILSKCIEDAKVVVGDFERYQLFENFRHRLNEALPTYRLFTVTARDFEYDRKLCMNGSEALLQRLLLYNSTDRWRNEDHFIVGGEEQWAVAEEYLLPSLPPQKPGINPIPDLAMFFKFGKIFASNQRGRELLGYINESLLTCIKPDGNVQRCFPFLFIEAKRRDDTLIPAKLDCIYEANQALRNIYMCMLKAGTADKFDKVRVFSIAMNAEKLEVRVHFAQTGDMTDTLQYEHYLAETGEMSFRDALHHAIRSILQGYASKTLLGILKETFERLIRAVSWEVLGDVRTREKFGKNSLRGIPIPHKVGNREKFELGLGETSSARPLTGSQGREKSRGRRQRSPKNQQGEGSSKKPRPDDLPSPSPGPADVDVGDAMEHSQGPLYVA